MAMSKEEVKAAVVEVMKKASIDRDFRNMVLDDPAEALAEVSGGKKLPDGYKLSFVEGDPEADETLTLPKLQTDLSDEDLDQVSAAGVCPTLYIDW
ncbi:MAG: NHLP leader peptide family RiPP precursor [Bacillota bacterium]